LREGASKCDLRANGAAMTLRIATSILLLAAPLSLSACVGGFRCGDGTLEVDGVCVPEDGAGYTCADACEKQANVCGHFRSSDIGACTDFCRALDPADRTLTCFRDSNCAEIGAKTCAKDGGGEGADHTARCAAFCEGRDLGPGYPACNATVRGFCQDRCLDFLDGFSTTCAACVLSEATQPRRYSTECNSESWSSTFTACASSCTGNDATPTAAQRDAVCTHFCKADVRSHGSGPVESCSGTPEANGCLSDCRAALDGLSRRCVACALSESSSPRSYTLDCDEASFESLSECGSYCSG